MALAELFLGMAIAGVGIVLCAVGLAAWRRTGVPKMLLTAAAFACAAAGGALFAAFTLAEGAGSPTAALALASLVLLALLVFYFALFGRDG